MASSCGEDASKSALRESYLAVRKALSPRFRARLDGSIASNLRALPEYRRDTWLLAYVPFEDEIPTRKIIERAWADGKRVALPRCIPGPTSLKFVEVSSLDGLRAGARGVLEPVADEDAVVPEEELADSVCLVPGLVFDAEGTALATAPATTTTSLRDTPARRWALRAACRLAATRFRTTTTTWPWT